jgi:hypothetical protein
MGVADILGDIVPPRPEVVAEVLHVEVLEHAFGELARVPDEDRNGLGPMRRPHGVVRRALRRSKADRGVRIQGA